MDYQDLITLARQTVHVGVLVDANASGVATNASCGDSCTMSVRIVDGKIAALKYEVRGCVISRAAAAVLSDSALGPIRALGDMDGDSMRHLLGAQISSLRERCLTTALVALQNAINSYET